MTAYLPYHAQSFISFILCSVREQNHLDRSWIVGGRCLRIISNKFNYIQFIQDRKLYNYSEIRLQNIACLVVAAFN